MTGSVESSSSNPKKNPIDIDDPLYVHPSDNIITSVINLKLLGTKNFRVWRSSMIRALKLATNLIS